MFNGSRDEFSETGGTVTHIRRWKGWIERNRNIIRQSPFIGGMAYTDLIHSVLRDRPGILVSHYESSSGNTHLTT